MRFQSEYLQAWAKVAKYPHSAVFINKSCGELGDEVAASTFAFPSKLGGMAAAIPCRNRGPFPLVHVDFGHNNIVVGVIDREHAFDAPWETMYFPLTLSTTPKPMNAP